MSQLVTIFGGSGFVGRYIAQRMARAGWRVRVAVRRPNEALFVRTYGAVGQVEPILANIRNDASVATAVDGADAVINCVGILAPDGFQNFDTVHVDGAGRVARAASAAGVGRLVQISAIGADPDSSSDYARTKARGEAAVLEAIPEAVILRPSIVFGAEDGFFNRFAALSKLGPVLPVVGAETRFQPVFVDDVAAAAVAAATGTAAGGIYELGGPDVESFRDLMTRMLNVIRRRRLILNIPFGMARLMALFMEIGQVLSMGLVKAQITRDQVENLRRDNVVSGDFPGFEALGIEPTAMEAVLESYLYCYRPSGQYAAIKESAANLRQP